jgi:triosephosphate isomerase
MNSNRRPLIAGNWKMYKTVAESRVVARAIFAAAKELPCRLGLFPTALALGAVLEEARSRVPDDALMGSQNIYDLDEGAFTGEISAPQVAAAGGNAVIVGHSERRSVFREDSDFIGRKVKAALAAGLTPILCVGETFAERNADATEAVVRDQLRQGLAHVADRADLGRVIIAYEPVWAIGTGLTAKPAQAQAVHASIRYELGKIFDAAGGAFSGASAKGGDGTGADSVLILYGGSVKPNNAREILVEPDVDGALVGGASLDSGSFLEICRACAR